MRALLSFMITLSLLSACTQPPAPVSYKGNEFYGRDGGDAYWTAQRQQKTYSANSPRYKEENLEHGTAARLDSIGVSNLAPIQSRTLSAPAPQSASRSRAMAAPSAPASVPANAPFKVVSKNDIIVNKTDSGGWVQKEIPFAVMKDEESGDAPPVRVLSPAAKEKPVSEAKAPPQRAQFVWPVEGTVISRFGPKKGGIYNDGINIATDEGEPIWAAAGGEVVYAGNNLKGYGNTILIRHGAGWFTTYSHANRMLVKKDSRVTQGQIIGYVGSSGEVEGGPQLYFSLRQEKTPVNPEDYLPRRVAEMR